MTGKTTIALCSLLAIGLGAAAFWWRSSHDAGSTSPQRVAAPQAARPSAPVVAQPASAPSIRHPMLSPAASTSTATPSFDSTLSDLFGNEAVKHLFRTDDFAHRFVATVDNLGRSAAPASIWPMNPASGRFLTSDTSSGEVIQPDNGLRYVPYVLLLEQVDMKRVAHAYAQNYPAFQHAYEEIGFPQGYFNDRLIEVLDLLIATPEAAPPIHVHRPVAAGVQPTRPWLLYEFDDPALQSLTAGQRLLLRMGPIDERRVKKRLAELRGLLLAGETGASR
jgi:hypothetical protein